MRQLRQRWENRRKHYETMDWRSVFDSLLAQLIGCAARQFTGRHRRRRLAGPASGTDRICPNAVHYGSANHATQNDPAQSHSAAVNDSAGDDPKSLSPAKFKTLVSPTVDVQRSQYVWGLLRRGHVTAFFGRYAHGYPTDLERRRSLQLVRRQWWVVHVRCGH